MKAFVDFTGDLLPPDSLEELVSGQGRILSTTSVCELLTGLQRRRILFDVLLDADSVSLDFVSLTRTDDSLWEIVDLRPGWQRSMIQFVDDLPWETGQVLDLIDDRFVSEWAGAERRLNSKEGLPAPDYTSEDLDRYEQTIIDRCGRSVIFTFDFVMTVQSVMNDTALELFAEWMDARSTGNH